MPSHSSKPAKPRPDFPLFPHASGQWAKKIKGRMHYFGKWDDAEGAQAKYNAEKDDLYAGRTPRPDVDGVTVAYVCNSFLQSKQEAVSNGELSSLTWDDYRDACKEIAACFGKNRPAAGLRPEDFAKLRKRLATNNGPHRLGKMIQCVRCTFKYGFDAELLDRPVRFGPGFKRPSKKTLRLHRAAQGPRLFTTQEIRRMLDVASAPMRAMILLGINCGYGNADCGRLRLSDVDINSGWIDYPRPKTGVARRNPLWTETVAALRVYQTVRPTPKQEEAEGLFFVTKYGDSWTKKKADSPISKEMRKLLDRLGINDHRNFLTLRHTFRTVADGARDQPAADYMMGHEAPHMSSHYRETIEDERLLAIVRHVHGWLFESAR